MHTISLLDQTDGLGINSVDELYIPCNEGIDPGDRVRDPGYLDPVQIGAFSPVILVADVHRFYTWLKGFKYEGTGTVTLVEVLGVLF